jgi:hypothetical protein
LADQLFPVCVVGWYTFVRSLRAREAINYFTLNMQVMREKNNPNPAPGTQ